MTTSDLIAGNAGAGHMSRIELAQNVANLDTKRAANESARRALLDTLAALIH